MLGPHIVYRKLDGFLKSQFHQAFGSWGGLQLIFGFLFTRWANFGNGTLQQIRANLVMIQGIGCNGLAHTGQAKQDMFGANNAMIHFFG